MEEKIQQLTLEQLEKIDPKEGKILDWILLKNYHLKIGKPSGGFIKQGYT